MTKTPAYNLRYMTEEDLSLVFKWRNHASVRRTAFNKQPISWDEHVNWWAAIGVRYVFLEDGRTIGVLHRNHLGYWSFYLDPDLPKRKGYGLILLSLAIAEAKRRGETEIKAHVFQDNPASLKLHKQVGFKVIARREGVYELCYSR